MESWAPGVENFAWNVFSFGPGACQKKPKMKCSGAQSLKVRNVCKPYYLLHLSHLGDLRGQSSEGRRGSFGGFFEKLRRSSVLNANVGAVSSCTCVATGVPWALLGSTWTRSKGQRMAQVFAFLRVFIVPGVFLKAFWKALGQQSEQRGHRSCNICSHEFRLRECGR